MKGLIFSIIVKNAWVGTSIPALKRSKLITILLVCVAMAAQAQNSPEEKFNMAMYAVTNMYVDSVNKAKFVDDEIAKMLKSLDPFSEYLPPMTAKANEEAILGLPSSPASSAGNPSSSASNVSSSAGKVSSSSIPFVPSASFGPSSIKYYYMADKTTGYICLTMFSETTLNDFRKAVSELKKKGMKNLVLDLRANNGGLFDVAVALADEFLDGDKVIVHTQGAHIPNEVYKAKNKGMMEKGKLVLLVGDQTKSAAEIFSAAIRDWDRGVLVGKTTFGKGLIQQTMPFSDGSALRITVARYLTPAGISIQKPYHGMVFADSTKTWQSLRTHRLLRCQGGVSADIDVNPSADYMTNWYSLLTYCGVQTAVAKKFVGDLKEKLLEKYPTSDKFIKEFQTTDDVMKAVCQTAEQAGIPMNVSDYAKSEAMVRAQMKAVICSQLYQDNNLYYKLFNTSNHVVNRALEIINSKEYDQILDKK